jgi:hypothetical protein
MTLPVYRFAQAAPEELRGGLAAVQIERDAQMVSRESRILRRFSDCVLHPDRRIRSLD